MTWTHELFAKRVLKDKYINYLNEKLLLKLVSLEEQRQILCLKFAQKNAIKTKVCMTLSLKMTKQAGAELCQAQNSLS